MGRTRSEGTNTRRDGAPPAAEIASNHAQDSVTGATVLGTGAGEAGGPSRREQLGPSHEGQGRSGTSRCRGRPEKPSRSAGRIMAPFAASAEKRAGPSGSDPAPVARWPHPARAAGTSQNVARSTQAPDLAHPIAECRAGAGIVAILESPPGDFRREPRRGSGRRPGPVGGRFSGAATGTITLPGGRVRQRRAVATYRRLHVSSSVWLADSGAGVRRARRPRPVPGRRLAARARTRRPKAIRAATDAWPGPGRGTWPSGGRRRPGGSRGGGRGRRPGPSAPGCGRGARRRARTRGSRRPGASRPRAR